MCALATRRIRPHQTISTQGISGNAHVVNVAGDQIINVNDGLGAEIYDLLGSIEERLKVVHDKELGTSAAACIIPGTHVSDYPALDKDVQDWLSAPDVSQNFNAALRRRKLGTGAWFIEGPQFAQWKERPNNVLCIYGAREFHLTMIIPNRQYFYQPDAGRQFYGLPVASPPKFPN